MAHLFGRERSRQELARYTGDLSQVAGVRMVELADGPARGIRAAEFRTASGLDFTVLLDRGLDIAQAHYKGMPLAWLSPAGFSHPSHYEPDGLGWLRTFGGGLLTGCGLSQVGSPNMDDGENLGLHGRLSNLASTGAHAGETWEGDRCCYWLEGQVKQARLYGENLMLTRRISTWLGESRIVVRDVVENLASTPSPLMILYHINVGFPMLDESAHLEALPHAVAPRDQAMAPGIDKWMVFQPPTRGQGELVFDHDLPAGADGMAEISLVNAGIGLRLTVRHSKATLPILVQWKQMGEGAYVLGIEPSNCRTSGRASERAAGTLQFIQPGESREFVVELAIEEMA